jgi:hypothetical protein
LKISPNCPFLGRGKANLNKDRINSLKLGHHSPIIGDGLLDILDITADVLREGLDSKIVVKLNVVGIF